MNNATIFAADRTTHVKIVTISLVASIVVSVVAVVAHTARPDGARAASDAFGPAVKAGRPVLASRSDTATVR
jgi:hypothetical protein